MKDLGTKNKGRKKWELIHKLRLTHSDNTHIANKKFPECFNNGYECS